MKTIIISDLHNRVDWIEPFLSSIKYDSVIFLGDYFDEFNDTLKDIQKSTEWLKQSLQFPNRIHLMGTHDMWYRFPDNLYLQASGNTEQKSNIINHTLTQKDWYKLKLYYFEQNFLLTHAGLHISFINKYEFEDPCENHDIINDIIKVETNNILYDIKNGNKHSWISAGFARGGRQPFGGITWLDWNREFEPIPNLNQIVGHTEVKCPQEIHTKNSLNYNLDTRNKHIGILENGNFSWIINSFLSK